MARSRRVMVSGGAPAGRRGRVTLGHPESDRLPDRIHGLLTDLHVHLRPDDVRNTPPEQYFTAANAERYRAAASDRGIDELGVREHVYRFTEALDVWQHELWRESARDDLG